MFNVNMSLHKKEKKFLILSKRVVVKCFRETDRCTVLVLSILFILLMAVFSICIGILIFYVYTLIFS